MTRRIVFHIDANSAYLSWEAAYRLQYGETIDLRTIPSIVGGDINKRHGIVLAKSIPAKKYNIFTGETIYSALQKCPALKIVAPNYERYIKASDAMVAILREYSPLVQRYSIDESFLDYSNMDKCYLATAYEIKDRIEKDLGFTVNIGISSNKLLAKMASDFEKPNLLHTLFPHEIKEKMWPLDVGDLFMVGRKTKSKLNGRGILTIGDLAKLDREYIYSWLKKPGLLIWDYANGIDHSPVSNHGAPPKSLGNSTTTAFDVDSEKEASLIILAISEMVAMRARKLGLNGGVISLSLKDDDFYSHSHQRKLSLPTSSTNVIYRVAKGLFKEMWSGKPLRQFSLSLSELSSDEFMQLSMMQSFDSRERALNETIDSIRDRYGHNSIIRSSFLYSGIEPIIGGVIAEEEYPMMSSKI